MNAKLMAVTAVVIMGLSGLSFAQMEENGKDMMKDKTGMMEGKCMKCEHMKKMGKGGMMGMMNKPSMVAVGNGVVVLSGHKLYKYDSNLNLVKEAEIKMDMGMKEKCKMCATKMKEMGDKDKDDDADDDKDADEHAAHHPENK